MAHNLVIGGHPDFLGRLVESWSKHGREIVAGDAEIVLEQSPSRVHRAPSVGSGEHFYQANLAQWVTKLPRRGILGSCHNLQDVGAKVRATVCRGGGGFEWVMPTSTVSTANTAKDHTDVDQDPYGTITTYATPSVQTTDFHIEVGFSNSDPLQLDVLDSQIILVLMRQTGTHGTSLSKAVIEVKEGSAVRAKKELRVRLNSGDTMIVSVLVNPNAFIDKTLNGMTVRCTSDHPSSGGGFVNWDFGAIVWGKYEAPPAVVSDFGLIVDTGWWAVESGEEDLYHMGADTGVSSILPYLDAKGLVLNSDANVLRVHYTWDETSTFNGVSFDQRDRIFDDTDGHLTGWRPEIGIVTERPALGTTLLQPQYVPGVVDPSVISLSDGGNVWAWRLPPRRTLELKITEVAAAEFCREIYSVFRRAGASLPFLVAVTPPGPSGFAAEVSAALSLYGRCVSFNPKNLYAEKFEATMRFEEWV